MGEIWVDNFSNVCENLSIQCGCGPRIYCNPYYSRSHVPINGCCVACIYYIYVHVLWIFQWPDLVLKWRKYYTAVYIRISNIQYTHPDFNWNALNKECPNWKFQFWGQRLFKRISLGMRSVMQYICEQKFELVIAGYWVKIWKKKIVWTWQICINNLLLTYVTLICKRDAREKLGEIAQYRFYK